MRVIFVISTILFNVLTVFSQTIDYCYCNFINNSDLSCSANATSPPTDNGYERSFRVYFNNSSNYTYKWVNSVSWQNFESYFTSQELSYLPLSSITKVEATYYIGGTGGGPVRKDCSLPVVASIEENLTNGANLFIVLNKKIITDKKNGKALSIMGIQGDLHEILLSNDSGEIYEFDTQNLSPGLYILQFSSGLTKRFIIN